MVHNLGRFRHRHPYQYCQRYFSAMEGTAPPRGTGLELSDYSYAIEDGSAIADHSGRHGKGPRLDTSPPRAAAQGWTPLDNPATPHAPPRNSTSTATAPRCSTKRPFLREQVPPSARLGVWGPIAR
jgi:hypothetical protein